MGIAKSTKRFYFRVGNLTILLHVEVILGIGFILYLAKIQ